MKGITINGNNLADYNDAEFEREVTQHLHAEARSMAKCCGHHSTTRPELRSSRPGRPNRSFDVLKWFELEQLLKKGTPKAEAGAVCGLTRRQVRHYIKHFVTRIATKPIYPSVQHSDA
jgi:hypothetical protein